MPQKPGRLGIAQSTRSAIAPSTLFRTPSTLSNAVNQKETGEGRGPILLINGALDLTFATYHTASS